MEYKFHKMGSYNIHTIKTDKFKTVNMEIVFRNNVDKERVVRKSILFEMLTENSNNYKTKRELNLKLESLYNASCYTYTARIGNNIFSSLCLEFLNPKYTKENYLANVLKFPFELLFNPNTCDNEFDESTLEIIKTRFKADYKATFENPRKLAITNALNSMDSNSVSALNIAGDEEKIDEVTTTNLYEEYIYTLEHDYVDIFIIGDIDDNKVIDYINKYANFKTIKTHELSLYVDNSVKNKINKVKEEKNISQSQLVYILNTVNLTKEEKKYAMQIYNMILGGGSLESKLYQNLRVKKSLCYNVSSIYNKYDNLFIIYTGIDKKNINLAKKMINETLLEMNNITEDELNHAKSSMITSINASLDNPSRIIANYLFNYIGELDSVDKRIKNYKNITLKDIKNINKKIKINTIYVLEGGKNNED